MYTDRKLYQGLKRVFDVLLSIVLLPFALPLIFVCALAVQLDSDGPAFFIQERVGKDGRRFRIYKFRTMQHNLDDSSHRAFMKAFVNGQIGNVQSETDLNNVQAFHRAFISSEVNSGRQIFKPAHDSQITHVGRILRKTSLDELPQIFNIIKGEMSWIGPRPNVTWEVEAYQPWHYERLEVLPGITGLAQVNGRSGINFDTIVQYDVAYVENQNLGLDLKILWQTVATIFTGRGAS
ncbi:MAG: sugar transferase [Anaerolineae bacterium]|nr:sugar transferase [Anaerolineae bacterium]